MLRLHHLVGEFSQLGVVEAIELVHGRGDRFIVGRSDHIGNRLNQCLPACFDSPLGDGCRGLCDRTADQHDANKRNCGDSHSREEPEVPNRVGEQRQGHDFARKRGGSRGLLHQTNIVQ